jgi:hypothetical protein
MHVQQEPATTAEACGVPGLSLLLDFVSLSEEAELLAAVQCGQWELLAKRRVQHYGYPFDYVVSPRHAHRGTMMSVR